MTEEIIKKKQEFLDKMSKIDVKPYLFTKNNQMSKKEVADGWKAKDS